MTLPTNTAQPVTSRKSVPEPKGAMTKPKTVLPLAQDLKSLLGDARRRTQTPIKSLYKYFFLPDMLTLAAGLPHPSTFAFEDLQATVPVPGQATADNDPESSSKAKVSVSFFPAPGADPSQASIALAKSLQYGTTRGIQAFQEFARAHIQEVHAPPYADWDVIGTTGNTDALSKSIGLIGSPGDSLLVDEWTYPAAVDTAQSHGVKLAPVPMDHDGMDPTALDTLLSDWTKDHPNAPKPKMVYLVPTGQNPTGVTMPLPRRRAIYQLAQKHNLVIFEDDPYYYMQYAAYQTPEERAVEGEVSQPGLSGLMPSFLSMDVDGRVIRMDSFSKVLAPGTRVGWITASAQFIPYIEYHNETTCQQPSGFSQSLVTELLTNVWGHDGWTWYLENLQLEYYQRRNLFMDVVQKHIKGLAEYVIPNAGMFLWLRALLPKNVTGEALSGRESTKPIMEQMLEAFIEARVMIIPGYLFAGQLDRTARAQEPYFRAAFSFTDPKDFEPAVERVAKVLRQFKCGKSA
ncbi:putative secondary metabolism biosynthetic enzyme [Dispira simplex]|nr:putative secondary metabolism biosynthetic enzyme [Dispira simplex]